MIDFTLSIAVAVVAIGSFIVSRNLAFIRAKADEGKDPAVAEERAALGRKYRVNAVGLTAAVLALLVYVLTVLTIFEKVDQTLNAVILSVLLFFPYAIAAAFVYALYGLVVTLIGR